MNSSAVTSQVGVVVSTFNRPEALSWVLAGLFHQRVSPSVICVADDGSESATTEVVGHWQSFYSDHSVIQLEHVWQPDDGFQLAKIRNRAAEKLRELGLVKQVIFLDGDCIPRPTFVESHHILLRDQQDRFCVAGGRVLLTQQLTAKLERQAPLSPSLETAGRCERTIRGMWLQYFRGGLDRVSPLITLPDGDWRLTKARDYRVLRGCNFSMHLSDYFGVGGCSEDFQGWGLEDSDLAIRLIASGVRLKSGRCATNVYHLWHPEADRSKLPEHQSRLNSLLERYKLGAPL